MAKFRLPMWVSPRFLWILGGIAAVLACVPGAHVLLFVAIIALLALIVATIGDAVIGPPVNALTVMRRLPEHLALRSRVTYHYDIENHSTRDVTIGIVETPARTVRFEAELVTCTVPALRKASVAATALPVARGKDALGTMHLWYENRFGLLRRRMRIDGSADIRVYPDLSAVERYGSLHMRNRLIEAGLRRIRMRGLGTEFESLREYATGDAFRSIDWKATARRGKLMVAQREVERSQDVMLVLDCGRLMTARIDEQRKLDYGVTAALSVASIASLASDRVGVVAFARDVLVARAPRSTASSVQALSNALYDVEPRFEESDYARAFGYVRSHLHRRSLVVLFTDVIDPIAQGTVLAELTSLVRHHVVVCVFMNDAAIADALSAEPATVDAAYRSGVAVGLAHERLTAKTTLERLGVHVVDVPAPSLSIATIDEYLRIKQRALI